MGTHSNSASASDPVREPWSEADGDLAAQVWDKLSEAAKKMFSILIDHPGTRYSGDDLAAMLNISNGKHGVAGLLGWPGRYCHAVNREWLWSFNYPDGDLVEYWMSPENAALFSQARGHQQ